MSGSMPLWEAALLGAVEGLTEFLPVSSTGVAVAESREFAGEVPGVRVRVPSDRVSGVVPALCRWVRAGWAGVGPAPVARGRSSGQRRGGPVDLEERLKAVAARSISAQAALSPRLLNRSMIFLRFPIAGSTVAPRRL